jgi:hypothetical protein
MKRFTTITLVAMFAASILIGCQGDGVDNDDVRRSNTRTSTRIESDGDRTTKTTKVTTDSDGNTVRSSKTTTVDR